MKYSFDKSLGNLTHRISSQLGRRLTFKLNKIGISVTPPQWSVISMLYFYKNQSQAEIALFLGYNKVRVKRLIDDLENSNIVKRFINKKDKRFNTIKLTKQGKSLYEKISPIAKETVTEAYNQFDKDEIEQCEKVLSHIYQNLINVSNNTD